MAEDHDQHIIILDDEEGNDQPEIIADDSPLRSENSTNVAALLDMIIDASANRTRNGGSEMTESTIDNEALRSAVVRSSSSSSCSSSWQQVTVTPSPSRQTSVAFVRQEQRLPQPVITVDDTSPGAQSNEAIYLSDSPPNAKQNSPLDEQYISNILTVASTSEEADEGHLAPMKHTKGSSSTISLVGYTGNNIVPQSQGNEFNDDKASIQSSVGARAISLNCRRKVDMYPQSISTTQAPGSGSNTESTAAPLIQPITASCHATTRSMPVTVEAPPSVVFNTRSCSTNQELGSTLQSSVVGALLRQIVGSNSESPQPTHSQTQQITVNAHVLDQVVKLAAFSWESLYPDGGSRQQHVVDLYRLLTNVEVCPGDSAVSLLRATSSICTQGNASAIGSPSSSSNANIPCANVIYVPDDSPPTTNRQIIQQTLSSKPIIMPLEDQNPKKSVTHNEATSLRAIRCRPSSSTLTAASDMEELIPVTTESSLSTCNESSFNSTLTEVTLEDSFDVNCTTPVLTQSKIHSILKREISTESTQSEHSAPSRKRPKLTNKNRQTYKEDGVQIIHPTDFDDQEEVMMLTNPASSGRDSHNTVSYSLSLHTLHLHQKPA